MNSRQFYEEVKKMRQLQKAYFRYRSQHNLAASKAQERLIDAEIERVEELLKGKTESQQMTINFDNHGQE